MNSEELELSLRTEFEIHLKDVLADMRQEFSQFQEKFQAEFDKHRSQLDTVFQDFSARLDTGKELDTGFRETVVEHLRLARDEGARITAEAIAEAEEMQRQSAPIEVAPVVQQPAIPAVGMSELRDAIKDITTQDSQGTILKSLVQHAAQFTPRGAFFIIKNENFVGWRVFNAEGEADEDAVRDVYLSVNSNSLLGESVRSLSAVESSFGTYADDAKYLNQIGFGEPEKMIAIPLVARGRGVAVLYADYGTQGDQVNVEALETLVRVAGLTVEVLASASQTAKYVQPEVKPQVSSYAPSVEQTQQERPAERITEEYGKPETSSQFHSSEVEQTTQTVEAETADTIEDKESADEYETSYESYQPTSEPRNYSAENNFQPTDESSSIGNYNAPNQYQPVKEEVEETQEIHVEEAAKPEIYESPTEPQVEKVYQVEIEKQDEAADVYTPPATDSFQHTEVQQPEYRTEVSEPTENYSAKDDFSGAAEAEIINAPTYAPQVESVSAPTNAPEPTAVSEPIAAAPVRSRFSDRNVDLPIEVSEDERRLHNDARRFARLLVSEIKLYNEQKVKEGRESRDLYDRLREAIDRSRDMYDKRVQPPVAAKFDYFHYELVSTLAEGEAMKLGSQYPGATS